MISFNLCKRLSGVDLKVSDVVDDMLKSWEIVGGGDVIEWVNELLWRVVEVWRSRAV